jgi:hypothetical protein
VSSKGALVEVAHSLGEEFAGRAEAHDEGDAFVSGNYAALKERRVFSAAPNFSGMRRAPFQRLP